MDCRLVGSWARNGVRGNWLDWYREVGLWEVIAALGIDSKPTVPWSVVDTACLGGSSFPLQRFHRPSSFQIATLLRYRFGIKVPLRGFSNFSCPVRTHTHSFVFNDYRLGSFALGSLICSLKCTESAPKFPHSTAADAARQSPPSGLAIPLPQRDSSSVVLDR